jgi:hypothetical protein
MKWYTCCNEAGLRLGGEWLLAALGSCLANTRLQPHLVYEGPESPFTRYLAAQGVRVLHHRLSFGDRLRATPDRAGFDKDWALGTFLRFDIPLIEREDAVVLYTDTDVLFCADIAPAPPRGVLAAANEYLLDTVPPHEVAAFNAGVLVLNVPVLRRLHGRMVEFAAEDGFEKATRGWYDQGVLNLLFAEFRDGLGHEDNWRPFARPPVAPRIIHFQNLKPATVLQLQRGEVPRGLREEYRRLYDNAAAEYDRAVALFLQHRSPAGVAALLQSCPQAVISA